MPGIIRRFPWPKSMRWGAASAEPGSLRWVRPLQSIVCTFGPETRRPRSCRSRSTASVRNVTYGHRFHAPTRSPCAASTIMPALERAKVVLDAERRKDIILHDARDLAFANGLELVEDEGLLEEVAGLVEWPVVLMGDFEESFLDDPGRGDPATIRANQKCFVLRDPQPEGPRQPLLLSPQPRRQDGGREIVAGNEQWCAPGCPTPSFSGRPDQEIPLDDRLEKLEHIVFHEKLGTQYERVERIAGWPGAGAGGRGRSRTSPSARPGSPRPTSSPRWSANSPSCRA